MHLNGSNVANGVRPLIYVVDDQSLLLELATLILEQNGFAVRSFSQPRSALQAYAVASPTPSVVITDFSMEGMNGLELIERCRLLRPQQKTLLISGAVDANVYNGFAFTPNAFLRKPYTPQQLIDSVEELLQGADEIAAENQFAHAA